MRINRFMPALATGLACAVALGCAAKRSDHIYGGPDPELEKKYLSHWKSVGDNSGDAEMGKNLFWGFDKTMKVPCAACHSFNSEDTMHADGDGQIRAGTSLFAAKHRKGISELSSRYVREGAKVFVPYWHDGPAGRVSTGEMSDIDAYLASQGGGADHPTAAEIDYSKPRYTMPAELGGGDPVRGAELAQKYCRTCHEVDGKVAMCDLRVPKLKGGVVPGERLGGLAARIRNLDGKTNRSMPGFPDDRMSEQDLRDVLAHFEKK